LGKIPLPIEKSNSGNRGQLVKDFPLLKKGRKLKKMGEGKEILEKFNWR
jgi:hypothetical protein